MVDLEGRVRHRRNEEAVQSCGLRTLSVEGILVDGFREEECKLIGRWRAIAPMIRGIGKLCMASDGESNQVSRKVGQGARKRIEVSSGRSSRSRHASGGSCVKLRRRLYMNRLLVTRNKLLASELKTALGADVHDEFQDCGVYLHDTS